LKRQQAEHLRLIPCLTFGFSFGLLIACLSSLAQTISPITSSGLNTRVSPPSSLPSGQVQYDITGGTRPGGGANLFHSFGAFGIPSNDIANFLNDSGLATSNILGRVTGRNISNIFGTIQTQGFESANLFLMNPAGFLFGPNATVNVGGMMSFTSADYLRHADGARFNAIPNTAAEGLLSASPVAAFGFLGSNPSAITVQGSQLSVAPGQSLSRLGAISLFNLVCLTMEWRNRLASLPQVDKSAWAAWPRLEKFWQALSAEALNINGQSFGNLGAIQVSEQSVIEVTGNGGSTVRIRGGSFVLDNSTISATVVGPGPVSITVQASQVNAHGAAITVDTIDISGNAPAGDISIRTQPAAGSVSNEINLTNSVITSSMSGNGNAGNINLDTGHLHLDTTIVKSEAIPFEGFTGGNAGTIQAKVGGDLTLTNSGLSTITGGNGNAGNILLEANSLLSENSVISSATFPLIPDGGNGGNIGMTIAQDLHLTNSTIESQTNSNGNAGNISVKANDLTLDSSSLSTAAAVLVNAGNIEVTVSTAVGGTITVDSANMVSMTNGSTITTSSTGPGNIQINAGNQFAMTDSTLATEAHHSGGGLIKIATDPNGTVQFANSTISAFALDGTGGGGSVNIDPQYVLLLNSHIIANAVFGPGGNVSITTNLLLMDTASSISASSQFNQSLVAPAGGHLIPLAQKPLIPMLLSQRCAALAEGIFSTFAVAGRDSLPAEPGGWLSNPLALATAELVSSTTTEPETRIGLSEPTEAMPVVSLRRIAPPGFLSQSFAGDWSGCTS
jgi:filamentous hemagglutinin family protein